MPFEVPKSWEWQTLGDIGKWQAGGTPNRGHKEYYSGDIPWLKTGDLNDGYITEIPERITLAGLENSSVKLNPKDSVLVALYGATIGKVGILTFPATTNQACCACVDYPSLDKLYLFYFLRQHRDVFISQGGGGAQPNISKEIITTTLIPVPPYKEQKRIVEEINRWFALIDNLEESKNDLQETIKQTKNKILDLAIHGKLVEQDPNDEPASKLLKCIAPNAKPCDTSHYPNLPFEIPDNWVWVKLGDISDYGKCQNVSVEKIGQEEWVLELEDIEKDTANIIQLKTKFDREVKGTRHRFSKGCVLYSKLRTYLNKVLVPEKDGFCTTEIIPINFAANIDSHFMCSVLRSQYFMDYTNQKGYGVKMPRLSTTDAKNGLIPLPPFAEQKRIVKVLEDVFVILDTIIEKL